MGLTRDGSVEVETTMTDFSVIVFSTIERALEKMKDKGGWFWWRYATGDGFWFNPRKWTRDEILVSDHVVGDGYLAMWSDMCKHLQERAYE